MVLAVSRERERANDSCGSNKRDSRRDSRENNTKLNHKSDFWGELSGLGASMKTLSMMAILNGVGQLATTCT